MSERLVQDVQVRVEYPTSSFSAGEQSDSAVAGCCRLIEQPADSQVTPENILAPHRRRTLRRTQGQDAMLRIQDGADLNFAEHPGCAGWGPIGRNKRSQGAPGLPMHAALDGVRPMSVTDREADVFALFVERRAARVALRWRSLPLVPPRRGEFRGAAPVGLLLVHLPEESPADAVEPLE